MTKLQLRLCTVQMDTLQFATGVFGEHLTRTASSSLAHPERHGSGRCTGTDEKCACRVSSP